MEYNPRQDDIHALYVAHLGVLTGIAHQNAFLFLLENRVVKGLTPTLRPLDVFHDLLQSLPLLAYPLAYRALLAQRPLPPQHQLVIVFADNFEGHVHPSEKNAAPQTGLMAGASLISPHHPAQEILDSIEYACAGEAVLVGLKIKRLVNAVGVLDGRVEELTFGRVDKG